MGRKAQRKSLVVRLGITPKVRWKKCDHYYVDAFRFSSWPSRDSEEDGFGFRMLWFVVSFAILVD
jgi:hypothetical protein